MPAIVKLGIRGSEMSVKRNKCSVQIYKYKNHHSIDCNSNSVLW